MLGCLRQPDRRARPACIRRVRSVLGCLRQPNLLWRLECQGAASSSVVPDFVFSRSLQVLGRCVVSAWGASPPSIRRALEVPTWSCMRFRWPRFNEPHLL